MRIRSCVLIQLSPSGNSAEEERRPQFCLWTEHSLQISLYLTLAFSFFSLNSEPTTYSLLSPSLPLENPTPFHSREAIIVLRLSPYLKKSGALDSEC